MLLGMSRAAAPTPSAASEDPADTTTRAAATARQSPGLWRHADFRRMWFGETVSEVGSAVTELAFPTVAVLQLGASAGAVGLLSACSRLPFPVLALIVGVYVDRLRRRPVMVLADAGRCVCIGLVPLLALFGALRLWALDLVALTAGVLTVLFDVAYLAYVPSLVGEEQLAEANAKLELSFSTAAVGGPGVGGLLIQAVGAARAVTADAASFLVSLVALLRIRRREPAPEPVPEGRHLHHDLVEGIAHVVRDPVLGSLALSVALLVFALHGVEIVFIVFAYRSLHLSPGELGVLLTVNGIGSIVGALIARRVTTLLGHGPTMGVAGVVAGVLVAIEPLALLLPAIPFLVGILIVDGACGSVQNVAQVTVRQLRTPARLRGRMNAVFRTAYWGAWPLGNLVGGILAAAFGTAQVIVGGGALAALSGVLLLVSPVGRVRSATG